MKIPFFTLERQNKKIGNDIKRAISEVVDSGIYSNGSKTKEFQDRWSELNNVKYTVFTGSGTNAIEIALKCYEINNDKVLVPTNTFIASASQIRSNSHVEFIDSDITCNLDIDTISEIHAKCLIGVNLYGQPLNFDKLKTKLNTKTKFLLDACQSHFSTYKNKPVAEYAEITVFSFYTTKSLGGAGEGGCLCTDNEEYAKYAVSLRDHGRSNLGYSHDYISGNLRGDEIQSAILLEKLKQKDEIIECRLNAVSRYRKNLEKCDRIKLLPINEESLTVNYVMPIFVENRDVVKDKLSKIGIATMVHYPIPLHLQPAFKLYNDISLPVAEKQCKTEISLPLFYGITDSEIDYTSDAVLASSHL